VFSLAIAGSSFAASNVADFLIMRLSRLTRQLQYLFATIPTRKVKKAFAAPDTSESATKRAPGMLPAADPKIAVSTGSMPISSISPAMNAVAATLP
jgi:hypothetical protein